MQKTYFNIKLRRKITYFRIILKPIRYFMSLYSNIFLSSKGFEDITTKTTNSCNFFRTPLSSEAPSPWNPHKYLHEHMPSENRESMGYIMTVLLSDFCSELWKMHELYSRVHNDRWRSSKVDDFCISWKCSCHLLLMINSSLGPISHHIWDLLVENCHFFLTPLLFYPKFEGVPLVKLFQRRAEILG